MPLPIFQIADYIGAEAMAYGITSLLKAKTPGVIAAQDDYGQGLARYVEARLNECSGQYGWSLSGGGQQMLAIGRALMARPRILLLAEQNTVMALSVARRGYVLEHGQIVLQGLSSDLIGHPRVREAYLGA